MTDWFRVNGIETRALVALSSDPTGDRRDIGAQHDAADGSLSLTRQTRKRDFKFATVPLSGADAHAWESMLTGEGNVWSFDTSLYSSKGIAGTFEPGDASVAVQTTFKKYVGALFIPAEAFFVTVGLGLSAPLTLSVWLSNDGGSTFHHVVARTDGVTGVTWLDGVAGSLGTFNDYISFPGGEVKLFASAVDLYVDDLVVCPYLWPDDWPGQVFTSGKAFGPAPFLSATGALVPETAVRRMLCVKCDEKVMKANLGDGDGMEPDVRVLTVELKGA